MINYPQNNLSILLRDEKENMKMDNQIKLLYEQIKEKKINQNDAIKLIKQLKAEHQISRISNQYNANCVSGYSGAIQAIEQDVLQEKAINYFKNLLSSVIKLPAHRIETDVPMEKFGIDSVMVMQMTNQLEKAFGSLSKTLFFEYRNIKELTEYFIHHHREPLMKELNISGQFQEKSQVPVKETMKQTPGSFSLRKNRFFSSPEIKETIYNSDIAIIGISGRYPMAKNLDEYWKNLINGRDCISEILPDRWNHRDFYTTEKGKKGATYSKWGGFIEDFDKFDPLFFNITPRDAELTDPQERLFLETTWQTIEDAGYIVSDLNKLEVGVFVGVMYGHYQLFGVEETLKGNGMALSSSYASIANRVSYFFDFRGPSIALDTMCSSSLTSIHLACESIRQGDCQVAIAGGVNLSIHPTKYVLLSANSFTASDGRCKSFGVGGDGYVPGEGVGAILLKPLRQAQADGDHIYAIIKATSINHDGKTNGYTVPNPNAQCDLILKAIKKANVNPRAISYIEAHGTGTSLGDPIEITGLTKAYGKYTQDKQFCAIGSVKSNIGHLESAAGIAGITKVLLQMKYKQLVPSIHSQTLNPNIQFTDTPFYVQRELAEWKQPMINIDGKEVQFPRLAGISAFGAGGANAHIILEEYEKYYHPTNVIRPQIVVLSARNEERLKAYAILLLDFLESSQSAACFPQNNNQSLLPLVQNDLTELIASMQRVNLNDIDLDSTFLELNFDRVSLANLTNNINEKYNLNLTAQAFSDYSTVRLLTSYLYHQYQDDLTLYYPMDSEPKSNQEATFSLSDIAYTLQIGREAKEERLAIIASDLVELKEKLRGFYQGKRDIENLYAGNANQTFFEGKPGDEFVKILIHHRDFHKLAQVWVTGAKVNWNLLYLDEKPYRISLPTYPFERKRYWYNSYQKNSAPEKEVKSQPDLAISTTQKAQQDKYSFTTKISFETAIKSYKGNEVSLQILDEAIAIITMQDINHRNMFSEDLVLGLMAKFGEIRTNEKIKTVIVTGYDNIFSMGGTQEQLLGISDRRMNFTDAPFLYRGLLETDLPVITAIQGHASGGGLLFGLYGDIIIMAEDGIYSAVFTKYGFTPGMGATYILKEKLGNNLATEMMFTAKSFTGEELKNRGSSVIFRESKHVLLEALKIAKMLAEKPVLTLKTLKQDLSSRILEELPKFIEREIDMHQQTFTNSEVKRRIQHYYLDGHEFNDPRKSENAIQLMNSPDRKVVLTSVNNSLYYQSDANKINLEPDSLVDILEALETGKIAPAEALRLRKKTGSNRI
jgi:polyketide synthase PksL